MSDPSNGQAWIYSSGGVLLPANSTFVTLSPVMLAGSGGSIMGVTILTSYFDVFDPWPEKDIEEKARRDLKREQGLDTPDKALRCSHCKKWMRFAPKTSRCKRDYVKRQSSPHANHCVVCYPDPDPTALLAAMLRAQNGTT